MAWHRNPWAGVVLRLAGAILLAIAYTTGAHLFAAPIATPDALDVLLAAILFITACAGSAMLVLGAHLFDKVAVSRRWAPLDPVTLNSFQGPPEAQGQTARWMLKQVQHDG